MSRPQTGITNRPPQHLVLAALEYLPSAEPPAMLTACTVNRPTVH
jgi:hypothetical protein